MEFLVPYSPLLAELPRDETTADLLCMSGIAVSLTHMLWLLNALVYFVRNPLPVLTLTGPVRFRTHSADKMYLLRLYRLADYLCMPEEILNSIALACFECFFLSDKWSPELLNYYPLEQRIQTLWHTFVSDYDLCVKEVNTQTHVKYPNGPMEVHNVYYLDQNIGDLHDVFGWKARAIVKQLRSTETTFMDYDLSHYVFPHEHTYTMNHILPLINKAFGAGPQYTMAWFAANVDQLKMDHEERQARILQAQQEGHDHTTCHCENCLATHRNTCHCRHHYQEEEFDYDDYYEPDWGYMAEMAWERQHGNGWRW
jgi:hypothetical protein